MTGRDKIFLRGYPVQVHIDNSIIQGVYVANTYIDPEKKYKFSDQSTRLMDTLTYLVID